MPYMRYKAGGRQVWRRGCRHCQILDEYFAARDAREALRESGRTAGTATGQASYMQLSDDEFDAQHPPVRLRDWLVEKAQEWRGPGAA